MDQNTIFQLIVLDEKLGFPGMLWVGDIPRIVPSDEKARADLLESFIFSRVAETDPRNRFCGINP